MITVALLAAMAESQRRIEKRAGVVAAKEAELKITPVVGEIKSQVVGGGSLPCGQCGREDCKFSDMRMPNDVRRYMNATDMGELKAFADQLIAEGVGICANCAPAEYWPPHMLKEHWQRARANLAVGSFTPVVDEVVGYCQHTVGCEHCEVHTCGVPVLASQVCFRFDPLMLIAGDPEYRQLIAQAEHREVPCSRHRSGEEVTAAFVEALRAEYIGVVSAEYAALAEVEASKCELVTVTWRCKRVVGRGSSTKLCPEQGTANEMWNPEGRPPKSSRGFVPIVVCRHHGREMRKDIIADHRTGEMRPRKVYPLARSLARLVSPEVKLRKELTEGRTSLDNLSDEDRRLLVFAAYMVGISELADREPMSEAEELNVLVPITIGGEEYAELAPPQYRIMGGGDGEDERRRGTFVNGRPLGPAFRERHLCGFDPQLWGCCGVDPRMVRDSDVVGWLIMPWWKCIERSDGTVFSPEDRGYIVGATAIVCDLLDRAARLYPEHATAFHYFNSFFAANQALKEMQDAAVMVRDEREAILRQERKAREQRLATMRANLYQMVVLARTTSLQASCSWVAQVLSKDWDGKEMPIEVKELKARIELGEIPLEIKETISAIAKIGDRQIGEDLKGYLRHFPVEAFDWKSSLVVRAMLAFMRTRRKVTRFVDRQAKGFGEARFEGSRKKKAKEKEAEEKKKAKGGKRGDRRLESEKGPTPPKASQGGSRKGLSRQEIRAMMSLRGNEEKANATVVAPTSELAAAIAAAGVTEKPAEAKVEETRPEPGEAGAGASEVAATTSQ